MSRIYKAGEKVKIFDIGLPATIIKGNKDDRSMVVVEWDGDIFSMSTSLIDSEAAC